MGMAQYNYRLCGKLIVFVLLTLSKTFNDFP